MSKHTSKNFNYTGKTVYIGIDVHKKTYSVTAICDEIVVKRVTMKAYPEDLILYLKKHYGEAKIESAYEAGFSGFHLHRKLVKADIHNIVIHAASMETSNDRVKTDKRDSLKIATHLSRKQLNGIYIPTEEREDRRQITRLRASFIKDRTRIANQIKSELHLYGLITACDDRKVSEKWIKDLSNLELSSGLKYSIEMHIEMWLYYNQKIKEINAKIKEQAIEDRSIDEVYQSAPGIGPTSARVLANEMDNLLHFKNERQLFKYLGLTPCEHSSGEHVRLGHITKQGKPYLRKILVQAAWTEIRHDKGLRMIFERIAYKAGAKRAIIAIARKLIGRIRSCFRTNTLYKSPTTEPILSECEPDINKQEAIKCVA